MLNLMKTFQKNSLVWIGIKLENEILKYLDKSNLIEKKNEE